jgi:ABC-type phosphate transport system substrate-binding protein
METVWNTPQRRALLALLVAFGALSTVSACTPQQQSSASSPVRSADSSMAAGVATTSAQTAETTSTEVREDADADTINAYVRALPKGRDLVDGDPERTRILDALRPTVERDLGQQVRFVVERLRTGGGFAALRGRSVRPDGGKIDYTKTSYKDAVEAGAFDDQVFALLQMRGDAWTVLKCDIGDTDWPGDHWLYEYEVPYDLFAQ